MPNKQSIFGHSMGGHGALISALKNPALYQSVSAFAPICNPVNCPWGKKALAGFLGPNENTWKEYDATELVVSYNGPPLELFIDQGSEDQFLSPRCRIARINRHDAARGGAQRQTQDRGH